MRKNPIHTVRASTVVALAAMLLIPGALFGQESVISLPDAITEAVHENPQLAAGRAYVRSAEAGVWEARSSLLPDVVAVGDYTRYQEPTLVNPMHGTPTPKDPLVFDEEIFTTSIRLDVPVLNLPALSGVNAAEHTVRAQQAQNAQSEQQIVGGILELFVQARQLEDNLTLMDGHIRALERRHTELKLLAGEGRVPPASVAEVEASLNSIRADRLELIRRRDELGYHLARLLGRTAPVVPQPHHFVLPDLTGELPATGPAGRAAEARLEAARAGREGALYSFAPRISGFAAQTARSGADIDFTAEWSVGLNLTLPLATGGERNARVRSAEENVEAALHTLNAAISSERTEAGTAIRRWESAEARRELLSNAVARQEISVAATEKRYEEGRSSLSDLLAAEATLLEMNMHERSLRYEQLLSYISYHEIAGNLSPALAQTLIEE